MRLNVEYIKANDLRSADIIGMCLVNQITFDEDSLQFLRFMNKWLKTAEQKGWIKYIKGNKSQREYERARLTKEGRNIFQTATTVEKISKEAEECWDILEKLYLNFDLKTKVEKKTLTLRYINELLLETGYTPDHFKKAVGHYLELTEKDFVSSTNNLIFKPKNAFQRKFMLEDSKIYQHIQKYLK